MEQTPEIIDRLSRTERIEGLARTAIATGSVHGYGHMTDDEFEAFLMADARLREEMTDGA